MEGREQVDAFPGNPLERGFDLGPHAACRRHDHLESGLAELPDHDVQERLLRAPEMRERAVVQLQEEGDESEARSRGHGRSLSSHVRVSPPRVEVEVRSPNRNGRPAGTPPRSRSKARR